jgi:FKBP-type peptidyl-prolyl cis-trans isomerase
MKKLLIVLVLAIIIGIIVFFYWRSQVKAPTSSEISSNLNKATSSAQLPDTISVEVLKPGFGAAARDGDVVTVNYIGYLPNGKVFDSSYSRGTPFSFTLGSENIIKGWNLGILGMKVGEKIKLTIPPDLGYGSSGAGNGLIPPNSSLIFEIELLKIN